MTNFDWVPVQYRTIMQYDNGPLYMGCIESNCNERRQTAGKSDVIRQANLMGWDKIVYCRTHGRKHGKFSQNEIRSWPGNHKRCKNCLEIKPLQTFDKHARCLFGYNVICKDCRKPLSKRSYAETTLKQRLWNAAKSRATKFDREFTITIDDINIPDLCPIFSVKMEYNSEYAPSIDRIDSRKGYTPDNICIMSKKANRLKNNGTREELEKVVQWMRNNESVDI